MDTPYLLKNITQALENKAHPTVTQWNRQEGRPRTDNFKRALRAEVRDALWMLSRQWQLGEFEGDDAGSPVTAQVRVTSAALTRFRVPGGTEQTLDGAAPLEAVAERKPIPFGTSARRMHLDLRLQLGRHFGKLLVARNLPGYVALYRDKYRFSLPQAGDPDADPVFAHPESWQQLATIAGTAMDGYELYAYLTAHVSHAASDGIALAQPAHRALLDEAGGEFVAWFDQMYGQPGAARSAWQPRRLEYTFETATASPGTTETLSASEYYQGATDWYVFDRASAPHSGGTADADVSTVKTLIPARVEFDGMPDTRFWAFEDGKTNFGNISPNTTDLAKLLLIDFALVYANDWFVIPFKLPINSVARVDGISVTNTFGERFWIEPSGQRTTDRWHQWRMFTLSKAGSAAMPSPAIVLPALAGKTQVGAPVEEVNFIRDEMANMVWGVEAAVPLINGYGRAGRECAFETLEYHRRRVQALGPVAPELPYRATASYLAMTQVPEHWIPFLPVHAPGDNREIQLQRSKMLRIIDGDTRAPEPVPPRTSLLREGLDESPKRAYLLHEEEVLRAGTQVAESFKRTRWTDGRVCLWLASVRKTGRGEGSSGLAFDQLRDQKTEEA